LPSPLAALKDIRDF